MARFFYILLFVVVFFACEGAQQKDRPVVRISLHSSDTLKRHTLPSDFNEPISLAISAMTSPKETYIYYEKLVEYISQQLGRPIQFKQRKSYKEVNELLKKAVVDIAFICSGAYVYALPEGYMEIIAVPVINNKAYYQAYIIVHKDSPYRQLIDLKNRRFALTDPLSNTGYYYPLRRVKELGFTLHRFFSKTIFTYAHDYSIQAVARKLVDGASVDGLIFDYLAKNNPILVENLRVIEKSEPFGMPPIVVPRGLNPKLKEQLQTVFLNLHRDSKGQQILSQLNIDRFIRGDTVNYSGILRNKRMAVP